MQYDYNSYENHYKPYEDRPFENKYKPHENKSPSTDWLIE